MSTRQKIRGFLPRVSRGLADHAKRVVNQARPWLAQGRRVLPTLREVGMIEPLAKLPTDATARVPPVRKWPFFLVFGGPRFVVAVLSGGFARASIVLAFAFAQVALAQQTNWYVVKDNPGALAPYDAWTNAAADIQTAIDVVSAGAGRTVWVSNGVYEAGGVTNFPSGTALTNRVAIWKAITVRSLNNDPTNTIIKGAWDPATNGPAAVRCVWMTNGSTLIGFTLTNGATFASGGNVERGGGVSCQSINTTISNCVLTGNSAGLYGGGAIYGTLFNCTLTSNSTINGGGIYGGTLFNCTLTGNSATNGGGAMYGTLFNCTLTGNSALNGGGANNSSILSNCTFVGNSAVSFGGGAYANVAGTILYNCTLTSNSVGSLGQGGGVYGGGFYATLTNCTLTGNSAMWSGGTGNGILYNCTLTGNSAPYANGGGGGARGGYLYNCTIVSNSTGNNNGGGGARGGILYNCLLTGNSSFGGGSGGGAYASTLYNCTLANNTPGSGGGGGVRYGTLINSIVYFNNGTTGSNWLDVTTFANTCTTPEATNGVGNITSDPLFVDRSAGNYRLRNVSPALNAGTNFSWMTPPDVRSKDLDGSRRIGNFSGQVDMGCYELMLGGTIFTGR